MDARKQSTSKSVQSCPIGTASRGDHAKIFEELVSLLRTDVEDNQGNYELLGMQLTQRFIPACRFEAETDEGKEKIRQATGCLLEASANAHPAELHAVTQKRLSLLVTAEDASRKPVFPSTPSIYQFVSTNKAELNATRGGNALTASERYRALVAYLKSSCITVLKNCPGFSNSEQHEVTSEATPSAPATQTSEQLFLQLSKDASLPPLRLVHFLQQSLADHPPLCSFAADVAPLNHMDMKAQEENHRSVHTALQCLSGWTVDPVSDELVQNKDLASTWTVSLYNSLEAFAVSRSYLEKDEAKSPPWMIWSSLNSFQSQYLKKRSRKVDAGLRNVCTRTSHRLRILKDYVLHQCDRVVSLCPDITFPGLSSAES